MIYRKMRSVPAVIAGIFLLAAAGWGVMPAGAGGGHKKAEKGRVEEKGRGGGMPMSGGQMKMGGHDDKGGHMEKGGHGGAMPMSGGHMEKGGHGGGHGAPTIKGLSKIQAKGFRLVSDLHCNACHYIGTELEHGEGHGGGHGGVAPDLTYLGDKFRPGWLYEFIRKPHTIRPWLNIRMPDFRLSESETVSLVKHLSRDMRSRILPSLPKSIAVKGGAPVVAVKSVFKLLTDVISVVIPPTDRAA